MADHAPTPWKRDEYGHIVDARGQPICVRAGTTDTLGHGTPEATKMAQANTDLFFAAPEMLAMLVRAQPYLYEHAPPHVHREIGALIKKAQGGNDG